VYLTRRRFLYGSPPFSSFLFSDSQFFSLFMFLLNHCRDRSFSCGCLCVWYFLFPFQERSHLGFPLLRVFFPFFSRYYAPLSPIFPASLLASAGALLLSWTPGFLLPRQVAHDAQRFRSPLSFLPFFFQLSRVDIPLFHFRVDQAPRRLGASICFSGGN